MQFFFASMAPRSRRKLSVSLFLPLLSVSVALAQGPSAGTAAESNMAAAAPQAAQESMFMKLAHYDPLPIDKHADRLG